VRVSVVERVTSGVSAFLTDPQSRSEYRARLKWLLRGSGSLPAWSLEYRAGLAGSFAVDPRRSAGSESFTMACPQGCATNAPLAHLYESRFTYELEDTVVNTVTGATVMCGTSQPPFFVRESISWPFESILSHGLDIPEVAEAVPGPARPTVVFPGTRNYYHWLIEELPLVVRARQANPDVTVIANANALTDRHERVARSLGFSIQQTPKTVRLGKQVLPGRASDSWFIHPHDALILEELGQRISPPLDPGAERIYVSRRGSARSLKHESHLESLLTRQGFTIVRPGDLSWAEQISAFQAARVVVGPHGAGLANLVFSRADTQVMELTNGNHYNRCFEWLCHVKQHRYIPISGNDGTRPTPEALAQAILTATA